MSGKRAMLGQCPEGLFALSVDEKHSASQLKRTAVNWMHA